MTQQLSWIERLTTNQKARGSNPFWVTKLKLTRMCEFFYLSKYILWIIQTDTKLSDSCSGCSKLVQACSNLQDPLQTVHLRNRTGLYYFVGPHIGGPLNKYYRPVLICGTPYRWTSKKQNRPVLIRRTLYGRTV